MIALYAERGAQIKASLILWVKLIKLFFFYFLYICIWQLFDFNQEHLNVFKSPFGFVFNMINRQFFQGRRKNIFSSFSWESLISLDLKAFFCVLAKNQLHINHKNILYVINHNYYIIYNYGFLVYTIWRWLVKIVCSAKTFFWSLSWLLIIQPCKKY